MTTLRALSRMHCPTDGPASLHRSGICVHCGGGPGIGVAPPETWVYGQMTPVEKAQRARKRGGARVKHGPAMRVRG